MYMNMAFWKNKGVLVIRGPTVQDTRAHRGECLVQSKGFSLGLNSGIVT